MPPTTTTTESRLVIVAGRDWLDALDRLRAATGERSRSYLIERALALEAARHGILMPPRCRPLGANQHDKGDTP